MRRLPPIAVAATALVIGSLLAACDTGDGTTLQLPVAPTTTAPVDTAPLPSLPLTDTALPGGGSLADALPPGTATPDTAPLDTATPDTSLTDVDPFSVVAPWPEGDSIDPRYTCDGAGAAPDISWTGVPAGTVELALSLVDESNLSNGRPFVHWVVAGIDPTAGRVIADELPPGAFEAVNFSGDVGYASLCPDPGTTGSYVLRLFAAGQQVEAGFEAPAADVLDIVEAVSFDVATLSGTVTR